MATIKVLLVGRLIDVISDAEARAVAHGATLYSATALSEVRAILAREEIDVMIVGAAIDLPERLAIARAAFEISARVSVHLKDKASGPKGFLPFVEKVIAMHLADTREPDPA